MTPDRAAPPPPPTGQSAGPSIDRQGAPVVDPTENVKALSEAAAKRQDDLRDAHDRLMAAEIRRLESEIKRLGEGMELRAEHAEKLAAAESKRLDAIRAVDVSAVSTAADRAAQAIQALAVTTSANAENLRTALNTTATTIAKQTADTVSQITERLGALEKSSYEGKGRSALSDPMMSELVAKMERMLATQSGTAGKSEGVSWIGTLVVGGLGVIATIIAIGSAIYASIKP